MNLTGLQAGRMRMPLCDMTDANLAVLKQVLADYGLLK